MLFPFLVKKYFEPPNLMVQSSLLSKTETCDRFLSICGKTLRRAWLHSKPYKHPCAYAFNEADLALSLRLLQGCLRCCRRTCTFWGFVYQT